MTNRMNRFIFLLFFLLFYSTASQAALEIDVTEGNLRPMPIAITTVIDKQNDYQESISKSLYEVNNFLSENIALNKEIKDEIKVLSKTIANISKKQ